MRYLLDALHVRALSTFLARKPLIALDFDGTLAPLTARRENVLMRPQTRALLAALSRLYPVAIISGRSRADLLPRLDGLGIHWVAGNHGMEQEDGSSPYETQVAAWRAILGPRMAGIAGAELEDKKLSLSLHYRNAEDPSRAATQIREAASELGADASVSEGKMVINVVPAGAPNKHDALRNIMERARVSTALFAGDDTTDEDIFMRADRSSILTVKVGCAEGSHATFCLRDQLEIDDLLSRICDARQEYAAGAASGGSDA